MQICYRPIKVVNAARRVSLRPRDVCRGRAGHSACPWRGMRHAIRFILFLIVSSALPLYAQSSVAELNEAGWKALQAGNSRRALALFNEALIMRPNDPVHADGRRRGAAGGRPAAGGDGAAEAGGRAGAGSQGRVNSARRKSPSTRAMRRSPSRPSRTRSSIQARRTGARRRSWRSGSRRPKVHSGFEEERYDRFRVMFEGRAEQATATQAVAILKRAFWRIGEKLGSHPPGTIVTILYTEQQFRDITRAPELVWRAVRRPHSHPGRRRLARSRQLFERVLVHELDARDARCDRRTASARLAA